MSRRPIKRPAQRQAVIQPLPDEVVQSLLNLIETKFYRGFRVEFEKDRRALMGMVVLRFAGWLNTRGVPFAGGRYLEILRAVFIDAAANMRADKIKYMPAYLGQVVKSYLAHNEETIYAEAKSFRNLLEAVQSSITKQPATAPDVVKDLVAAKRLLAVAKGGIKKAKSAPAKQLDFTLQ